MDPEVQKLLDELKASSSLDWKEARLRIHALHEQSNSFEERGLLLGIYAAVMDQVERSDTISDLESFKKTRGQDYNLFLIRESTDGENIDPQKLLAVCQREIAAGRMAADDEMHTLARYGEQFVAPPPTPRPTAAPWWKRVLSGR